MAIENIPLNGSGQAGMGARSAGGDPFDLTKLRLSQDFGGAIGVKKALLNVPVRRPDRHWFIRVHPDPAYRLDVAVIELRDRGETYIVPPEVYSYVTEEAVAKTVFTAITRQGTVFLWPIRLPDDENRLDDWNRSARDAVDLATTKWVRVAASRSDGAYQAYEATANLAEPEWPTESFLQLLKIAFKDRLIDNLDHPVLRALRGEV